MLQRKKRPFSCAQNEEGRATGDAVAMHLGTELAFVGGMKGFYTNPVTEQVISGRQSEALPRCPFKRKHIVQLQGISLADSLQVLTPSSSPQLCN